jgi:hypothetical protein
MNETLQSGLHPDADQLAAFAEQALPANEREQTLAHLAVCGDCRQIVFLAQAAAPEEVAQIVPATTRRPWFSGWNLLWPAVAALAGIVGFSIYLGRARVVTRTPQDVTTAEVSTPQAPPAAAMPKPIAPTGDIPAAKAKNQGIRGGMDARTSPPKPAQPAADAAVLAEDKAISAAPPKLPAQPQAASARAAAAGGIVVDGAPPTVDGAAKLPITGRSPVVLGGQVMGAAAAAPGTTQQPAPQQFRNYVAVPKPATATAPTLAAAPPPPPPPAPAAAPQFAQNQSLQNDQLRQTGQVSTTVNVEANAAPVQLDTTTSATLSSLVPVLPSHLETISSTSNGSDLLAVDSGGSVFLSHDDGKHWKGVSEAWAGRPVKVELAAPATTDRRVNGLFKKTAPPASQDADSNASATVMTGESLAANGGAQLHGVVTDPGGASIPGAQVRIQAVGATSATTVRTDAAGRFQSAGMPSGKYEVTITATGFSTLVRAVELDARTPMGFTAVLPVGAAAETVTVESAAGTIAAPKKAKTQKTSGFQLTTDTGVVWVSSDGRNWKRR